MKIPSFVHSKSLFLSWFLDGFDGFLFLGIQTWKSELIVIICTVTTVYVCILCIYHGCRCPFHCFPATHYILDLGNLCVAKFSKTDVLHLLPQGHRSHLGTHRVIFQSVELAAQSQHRDSDLPPLGWYRIYGPATAANPNEALLKPQTSLSGLQLMKQLGP